MHTNTLRVLFLFLSLVLCPSARAAQLPNIVLLVGDDHGYPYFGFMGNHTVVTPTMDTLADGGVVFTQGHVTAPYCRPSLRNLITGLHPAQYAQRKNEIVAARRELENIDRLSKTEQAQWMAVAEADAMREFDTLPKLLSEQGYASWEGGKWWERSYKNAHFTEGMTDGWDMSKWGSNEWFYQMWGAEGEDLARVTMEPLYDFIDRHQQQPYFIWFGPALPHVPLDAPFSFTKYYEHKVMSNSAKAYYANITWWDDSVSQLMDYIESKGQLDDTLFIYVSDNGWDQEPHDEYKKDPDAPYNDEPYGSGGMKGKGALYDLSFRSPIIFYWRGKIGSTFNETSLVSASDIVPTILDLVGARKPVGLHGHSLKPLLQGRTMQERNRIIGYSDRRRASTRETLFSELSDGFYVRTHRWHFMWHVDKDSKELYDVTVDPRAMNNVVEQYPDLIEEFMADIAGWRREMNLEQSVLMD
jgi:uncharacterized sulfatase